MLTNPELKKLSLKELIGYTNGLGLYLFDYINDNSLWKTLTEEQDDIVSGWGEGMREEFIMKRIEGRCSLKAFWQFDVDECITNTIKEYNTMRKLAKKYKLK